MSRVVQPHERAGLLDPGFLPVRRPRREIADVVRRRPRARGCSRRWGETLHLDTRLALVDNMLLYFDKMSMATSLEVRVPFMDHDVVSFCSQLPDSRKVSRHGAARRSSSAPAAGSSRTTIIDKPQARLLPLGARRLAGRATATGWCARRCSARRP